MNNLLRNYTYQGFEDCHLVSVGAGHGLPPAKTLIEHLAARGLGRWPDRDHCPGIAGRSSQAREQRPVLLEVTVAEKLDCRAHASILTQQCCLSTVPEQPLDRGAERGEVMRVLDQ